MIKQAAYNLAVEYLQALKERGPLAIARAKEVMNAGNDLSNNDGLKMEATVFGVISKSNDKAEGTKAFVEKRKPEFKGN